MSALDYVVIGAGISGLSSAWKLKESGFGGIVLEAADKPGGCIESVCFEDFCQELGAHSVFNSYQGLIKLIKSLEFTHKVAAKKSLPFLLWDDFRTYPITKSLNFLTLILAVSRLLWLKKEGRQVKEYYGAITGNKNFKNVIVHALNAVACQDIQSAPANFLFQKRTRNKEFVKKFSFKNGLGSFIHKLADSLDVKYKQPVAMVSQQEDNFMVSTATAKYVCKKLILAVPPQIASSLTKNLDPEISLNLAKISHSDFYSVGVIVKKEKVNLPECSGWIGKDAYFYSMVSADPTSSHNSLRGFTFHFKPDVGTKVELKSRALDFLNLTKSDVVQVTLKENLLPIIRPQHYQIVNKLDQLLQAKHFGLCGNYFDGMAMEDCVQRAVSEVARLTNLKF